MVISTAKTRRLDNLNASDALETLIHLSSQFQPPTTKKSIQHNKIRQAKR